MSKKILFVSAHPDDEILGAGGTLIRHRNQGDDLLWLIITRVSVQNGFSQERVDSREKEIEKVAEQLKAKVYQLDYPTMQLSSNSLVTLVPDISVVINGCQPERIYVMNRSDAHSDHRIVFDAVFSCTKSFRYPFIREVLMYECLSETEFAPSLPERAFIPNCFVDISSTMAEKLDLMEIYSSEMSEHPFPRSRRNIQALATFRGASCGREYAEAFQILKTYRFEEL
ncbi:MAG: LmbE family N-acetylglucosaminyl deacetylase [Sediminicola sp.]|jgi:LmbE family N-acetylglucosaminyl deacetylase